MSILHTALALALLGQAEGQPKTKPSLSPEVVKRVRAAADKAIAFYRSQQGESGSLAPGSFQEMGITGLAVTAILESKRIPATDPMIVKAMAYMETHVQPDGGIYPKAQTGQQNYLTSVGLLAFVAANKDDKYKATIEKAIGFLKGMQWQEDATGTAKVGKDDVRYGGFGYDSKKRPDLSNTSFTLEALTAAGLPKEDPAVQRAMVFLRRCQNYTGEGGNDKAKGSEADRDGGFFYNPYESKSPAGDTPTGGLRSYGSMTYAGLKSFVYAGLKKDDPRIQAALDWIKKHYSVKENPGMGKAGLFYYYQMFAKSLDVLEVNELETADGEKRKWREDLVNALLEQQKEDGSWINTDKRWLEGDARLSSAFALLALADAVK